MADPPSYYADTQPDTGVGPDPGVPAGTSRWQKVVGIAGLLVVLWVGDNVYDTVTGDFGGGGEHGPGQNVPAENQDQEPDADNGGGHTWSPGGWPLMTAIRRLQMQGLLRQTQRSLRAWPVFAFYALATLGYAAFIGLMFAQMALELDVFLPGQFGQMQHGAVGSHRVHDVTYGLLVTTMVLGVLTQLRRPSRNVSGMVMALIPFAGLLLAAAFSADPADVVLRRNPLYQVTALAAMTALVHPTGRRFFRSFRLSRVNWMMVALVGVAAVPLISFASSNIDLQGTVPDEHGNLGHYGFMAAFSFTVIAVGLLSSVRAAGWRLAARVAGLLPALVGITSLLYSDAASALDVGWALAAMAWGALFIAVAELTKDAVRPTMRGARAAASKIGTGPRT